MKAANIIVVVVGISRGGGINVPSQLKVRDDKYTQIHAVFLIGKSVHVKMVLVVCGFRGQSKDAIKIVLGVFFIGSSSSGGGCANQVLLYQLSFV